MEIGRNDQAASMGLNFAAFLRFVRNEATSILCSSLVVVALITFIELVLRPGMRRSLFSRLLEFKTKSYAQAQVRCSRHDGLEQLQDAHPPGQQVCTKKSNEFQNKAFPFVSKHEKWFSCIAA